MLMKPRVTQDKMERAMNLFRVVHERYINVSTPFETASTHNFLMLLKRREPTWQKPPKSILHLYFVVVLYNLTLLAMEGGRRRKPE
jgi:hypothetical protein